MISDRDSRPQAWLFQAGAALIYLACLSGILVHESQEPNALVIAFLAPSLLAGFVIARFWAVALPLGVVAISELWVGLADEDPVLAMAGGLLVGVVLAHVYEKDHPPRQREAVPHDAKAHRWSPFLQVLKPFVTRDTFDDALDRLRFRIDTFPHGLYQPVPSLTAHGATRAGGSESRWSAMLPVIHAQAVESATDIGACEGYFSIKLAAEGIPTIAIESKPSNYRTTLFAVRRNRTSKVGVLALEVTPQNVATLPPADCILCLSVWHHFVRSYGLDEATAMLERIWQQTQRVMFFDTGEDEMTPDYGLPPMTPDPCSWLTDYLAGTCAGARTEHLGLHRAFDPSGTPCERNLFAVIRPS